MTKPTVLAAALCIATFAATATASAQPSMTPPVAPGSAPGTAAPGVPWTPSGPQKSEATATNLALGGAVLPFVLFGAAAAADDNDTTPALALAGAASLVLTPSAGHWYAGKFLTTGMALRAGGALAGTVGFALAIGCAISEGDDCDGGGLGALLFAGGLGALAAGVIYDVATADNAVREYNARATIPVTVVPTALRSGGSTTPGLAVAGSF